MWLAGTYMHVMTVCVTLSIGASVWLAGRHALRGLPASQAARQGHPAPAPGEAAWAGGLEQGLPAQLGVVRLRLGHG